MKVGSLLRYPLAKARCPRWGSTATNAVIARPVFKVRDFVCLFEAHSLAESGNRRTNHNAMNIASVHLDALKALGYTEAEARFLYIVATHSGYFVARQFLAFANAHWGERTTTFWNKLRTKKHARTEFFPKSGIVYHLYSRRLYRQIDRENNRRQHQIEYIQRRIGILDFVLFNPQYRYLEAEPEKVSFFCDQLKIPCHFLPSKIYHGQKTSQPTLRYFADKFPMFLDAIAPSPVVTFTYLQGPEASLTEFVHHLAAYLPLFRQLSEFRVLYMARANSHFEKAKELFNSLVAIPLGSDVSADLLRYYQIRKSWDLGRYRSLSEADLMFRNQAKTRFGGQHFEHLYRGWKVGRVSGIDILQEFGGSKQPATVHFRHISSVDPAALITPTRPHLIV